MNGLWNLSIKSLPFSSSNIYIYIVYSSVASERDGGKFVSFCFFFVEYPCRPEEGIAVYYYVILSGLKKKKKIENFFSGEPFIPTSWHIRIYYTYICSKRETKFSLAYSPGDENGRRFSRATQYTRVGMSACTIYTYYLYTYILYMCIDGI